MVYRLAVCDDLSGTLSLLSSAIEKSFAHHKQLAIIDTYQSSTELWHAVLHGKQYDAYFLDIDIPELGGIELGEKLQKHHDTPRALIYISNREDRVFETFRTSPLRFVRKRHFSDEVEDAVSAVLDFLSRSASEGVVTVDTDAGLISLRLQNILYVESFNKVQQIVTTTGTHRTASTMEALEQQLTEKGFIRTHRGYLVNCRHIYRIDQDCVLLDQGSQVPMSRLRRQEVKSAFQRWIQ